MSGSHAVNIPGQPADEPYRQLQRLNRDRLSRAVKYIANDLELNRHPGNWKMLEVDNLLQSYREKDAREGQNCEPSH